MGVATVGHAIFAASLIALGLLGLVSGDFAPIWNPVPKGVPARELLVYLCAFVSLACGIGLLWKRTSTLASRVLLAYLGLWLLAFRVPALASEPTKTDSWFGISETAVYLAAAWVIYAWPAGSAGRFRIPRVLYGLSLITFGVAHFTYLNESTQFVPNWLPWHLAWVVFTGAAYLAAALSILTGVLAPLAAKLSAWQMGGFTVLVWFPIVMSGAPSAFTWSEFVVSIALTASAWVVSDSYRRSVELRP
ncbi:MAG TPA: hypothetical protein VGI57_01045 [Usitatibacter sp.]